MFLILGTFSKSGRRADRVSERVPLLCLLLGHQRSAKLAKLNPETGLWESVCTRCAVPMIRLAHRHWVVARDRAEQD